MSPTGLVQALRMTSRASKCLHQALSMTSVIVITSPCDNVILPSTYFFTVKLYSLQLMVSAASLLS